MAATGTRTPLAKEPKEDQAGVSATVGGSQPADGRDMGATTATSDTARAGGAQAAREGAFQQRGEAQRAALMEQAEEAAAKLKGLRPNWQAPGYHHWRTSSPEWWHWLRVWYQPRNA